ncbi:MAG: triose-phosphate isomerase [Methanomassiliicoccales archaeon]|nr:MAG: triose-phosphate isomerase [Methanomassiliicoccales archaeon]
MRTPVIILNFKAYRESFGERGLALAKICEEVAKETGASIVIAPQQIDLSLMVKEVDIPVLAQHVDPIGEGSFTGHISPSAVKEIGAIGTLLNHSERRLPPEMIKSTVEKCRDVGLETVVCANDIEMGRVAASFGPDYVAVEPPELIGGDISVTSANPEVVSGTVEKVKEVNPNVIVLCGAGVKNGEDVRKAIELGTEGVLLASGVVKATDPRSALLDLAGGL